MTRLVGQSVNAIDTPALVVDLDAMERNLDAMAAFANKHNIKLRPHAKMHKSAELAKLQMAAGAVGVCVQKTAEAEALAAAGVPNIYISNEVIAPAKLKRVVAVAQQLHAAGGQLAIAVDSLQGIVNLADAAAGLPFSIDVFVELDVGQARCGVQPGAAVVPLVSVIAKHAQLRFAGLQAYHGRAQHLRTLAERREAIASVIASVKSTIAELAAAGHTVPLVTGAGSGTFLQEAASGVYGELQAGSYLFMDRDYASNDADPAQPTFEHALFVKSQVISSCSTHAVVDAGHKSHAIDSGLPLVYGRHQGRQLEYANGGDEHGILRGAVLPQLGDTVWLIPGHCDPTVNLHNVMVGVRGGLENGVVERIIAVDARGCLT
jgi:D-serine deaminase-like pyridoxal phosphate-dependent protein